jgi:hypothetical protein
MRFLTVGAQMGTGSFVVREIINPAFGIFE